MTLRIFESFFYKSLIRACSFDNSLAASQNARSYVQTIDHRALRICKKCIQKVLMLSPFFLINISSYLLSDSYKQNTIQTTTQSVCFTVQIFIINICLLLQKLITFNIQSFQREIFNFMIESLQVFREKMKDSM